MYTASYLETGVVGETPGADWFMIKYLCTIHNLIMFFSSGRRITTGFVDILCLAAAAELARESRKDPKGISLQEGSSMAPYWIGARTSSGK